MTQVTCYGGVKQIGGNKILVEDGDARVWLDMGSPFGFGSEYFVDFLSARTRFGLRDYFALGLLPKIPGLYSEEVLEPTTFKYEAPRFSAVFLTHVHFDHSNHLQYIDPKIPLHLGEGTQIILDSWQATASRMDLKEHVSRPFRTGRTANADGLDVQPVHVDHSVPAAYGFILHTSKGAVVYTGDLRQHGPHAELTKEFIETARAAKPVVLISEGTRVAPVDARKNFSEAQVKEKSIEAARKAKGKLVIATFYPRDVDRMRTFLEVAKATGRALVLQAKAAHLLLSLAMDKRITVPDVARDAGILVYNRQMLKTYAWEEDVFPRVPAKVVTSDYVNKHQGELLIQLDFETLPELIDIKPAPGSPFIHSKSEPFEEDDEAEATLRNWVRFFKLRRHQYHASGHMAEAEIAEMVRAIDPKVVIPVHTEHPERFVSFGPKVVSPILETPIPVT